MQTQFNSPFCKRSLRVFISSTFEDMKEERHLLNTIIKGDIERYAKERGLNIEIVDLRWGISNEDTINGMVLPICLKEIDNSNCFISLIGGRYGTCLGFDEYNSNEILKRQFKWLEGRNELSYTEVEIIYGALMRENADALFLFRDDAVSDLSVKRLRECIRKDGRYSIISYDSASQNRFVEAVTNYLKNEVDKMSKYKLTDRELQRYFVDSRASCYAPIREESDSEVNAFVQDSQKKYMIITGQDGIGKTTFLSHWVSIHIDDDDRNIIYYFADAGSHLCNYDNILDFICEGICYFYCVKREDETRTKGRRLANLLSIISDKHPLVIVIDGNSTSCRNLLDFALPRNVKLIITGTETLLSDNLIHKEECVQLSFQPIAFNSRVKLVESFLDNRRKHLSKDKVYKIADSPLYGSPLLLNISLIELLDCDNCHLDERIDYYLFSKDQYDFFQRLIYRYEKMLSSEIVKHVLGILAASEEGLYEGEIKQIVNFQTQFEWSLFYCSFKDYLKIEGTISISSQMLKDAIAKRYQDEMKGFRHEIIALLINQRNLHAIRELINQYMSLGKYDDLYLLIKDTTVFEVLHERDSSLLFQCWSVLMKNNSVKYTLKCYLNSNSTDSNMYNSIASFIRDVLGRKNELSMSYYIKALSVLGININDSNINENNVSRIISSIREKSGLNNALNKNKLEWVIRDVDTARVCSNMAESLLSQNEINISKALLDVSIALLNNNKDVFKGKSIPNSIILEKMRKIMNLLDRELSDKIHNMGYWCAIENNGYALDYYNQALELKINNSYVSESSLGKTLMCIGDEYRKIGKLSEAYHYYDEANKCFIYDNNNMMDVCTRKIKEIDI